MPTDTPRTLLIAAGEYLYGPRWQSELARALGLSVSAVQRWVDGSRECPASVLPQLAALIAAREAKREALTRRIQRLIERAA